MTSDQRPSNGTAQIKVAEAKAGLYARIGTGIFFILAGTATFVYGLIFRPAGNPCEHNHVLLIVGGLVAIGGAMLLPSVFDAFKPVITFVFPNGIPIIGGRRVSDPPKSDVSQGNPS